MIRGSFTSIDQNSTPLWDAIPKLAALRNSGLRGTHYLEDIDVAFTRAGAPKKGAEPELLPECIRRGGGSDWGASMFYPLFLGRQPIDVRRLEQYTGWSTAALARRLDSTVTELYDRLSRSDNWQLVGPSYTEIPGYHRVIGDLTVSETSAFLTSLMELARKNLLQTFPQSEARKRISDWFDSETGLLESLIVKHAQGKLTDIYRDWVASHLPDSLEISLASELPGSRTDKLENNQLFRLFITNYPEAAESYNSAIGQTGSGLRPLDTERGDLPFFAVISHGGHTARTDLRLEGGRVTVARDSANRGKGETEDLRDVRDLEETQCVGAKALLLVLQARLEPSGSTLVLPYRGSLYMSTAYTFERELRERGLLSTPAYPVHRVRFRFYEHLKSCDTLIRLPEYLHPEFNTGMLTAAEFSEELQTAGKKARSLLKKMENEDGRNAVLQDLFPEETKERESLEKRRRELARNPETRPRAGELWDRIKTIDAEILREQVDWTMRQLHLLGLDYYDTRGAMLPWCIALGGKPFYSELLAKAEIHPEHYDSVAGCSPCTE